MPLGIHREKREGEDCACDYFEVDFKRFDPKNNWPDRENLRQYPPPRKPYRAYAVSLTTAPMDAWLAGWPVLNWLASPSFMGRGAAWIPSTTSHFTVAAIIGLLVWRISWAVIAGQYQAALGKWHEIDRNVRTLRTTTAFRYEAAPCTEKDLFLDASLEDGDQFMRGSKTHWRIHASGVLSRTYSDEATFQRLLAAWRSGIAPLREIWEAEAGRSRLELKSMLAVAREEAVTQPRLLVRCQSCGGHGRSTRMAEVACRYCGGAGAVPIGGSYQDIQRLRDGYVVYTRENTRPCYWCSGKGRVIGRVDTGACSDCRGTGSAREESEAHRKRLEASYCTPTISSFRSGIRHLALGDAAAETGRPRRTGGSDRYAAWRARYNQASALAKKGDRRQALVAFREAEAIACEMADTEPLQDTIDEQGLLLFGLGDMDGALARHQEQARICLESNNLGGLQHALMGQGRVYLHRGELDRAQSLFEEEERICREHGWPAWRATALYYLGCVDATRGDLAHALPRLQEAAGLAREHGLSDLTPLITERILSLQPRY